MEDLQALVQAARREVATLQGESARPERPVCAACGFASLDREDNYCSGCGRRLRLKCGACGQALLLRSL